ncbi:MAG: hypothetical protein QOC66_832 [Pseudonocardiales bacterium]|nr:hypothetical protein [Pseudonocardiales bacterium]
MSLTVPAGEHVAHPGSSRIRAVAGAGVRDTDRVNGDGSQISPREDEVLQLLGEPLTYAEIGARLFISPRTVESHVSSLRRKLGAANRRELARIAAPGRPVAGPVPARRPAPLSSFIGRTAEQAALVAHLSASRLVSAVGPGGVGKTRLALRVADELDGEFDLVAYVDLVPVLEPDALPAAVATACGGVGQSDRSATEAVTATFGRQRALLVLDNCEHLVDAVSRLVETLLERCPGLVVLVTSRVRLAVPHERVYLVPGLSLTAADGVSEPDAVLLFRERGGLPAEHAVTERVARICDALGGVALAIELAAGRLPGLGLDGLEAALVDQLGLLAGGSRLAPRHRSIEELLQWSHRLLSPVEQAVLARVSIFVAPFDQAAAASVVAFDPVHERDVAVCLASLSDQSLLSPIPDGTGLRYRSLEAVRQFGSRQLHAADDAMARRRHLAWAAQSAAELDHADPRPIVWCDRVDAVVDDLAAAVGWSRRVADARADGLALGRTVAHLLFRRGRLREAQHAYERVAALAVAPDEAAADLEAAAAVAACRVLGVQAAALDRAAADALLSAGDETGAAVVFARLAEYGVRFGGMFEVGVESDVLAAHLKDAERYAHHDPRAAAAILVARSHIGAPDDPAAPARADAALAAARAVHDPVLVSSALDAMMLTRIVAGDVPGAAAAEAARVAPLLSLADQPRGALELKDALHTAAFASLGAGDLPSSQAFARQHRDLVFTRADADLATEELFAPAALSGKWDEVFEHCDRYLEAWERAGRRAAPGRAMAPAAIALAYGLRGDDGERARWLAVRDAMRGIDAGAPRLGGYDAVFDAILLLDQDQPAAADACLRFSAEHSPSFHDLLFAQWHAALAAEAAVLVDRADRRERVRAAEEQVRGNVVATEIARRARALLDGDGDALAAVAAAFSRIGCPYQAERTTWLTSRPGPTTIEA